ncbi:MAG TPA: ROK family protein [Candidatus Acidoferrales bacterium]|nr:ROK family protein [Candidatus Acidoferrales bacterium]
MPRSIGVLATRYIWVGMVEGTTMGDVRMYPDPGDSIDLKAIPADEIVARIGSLIAEVRKGQPVDSVGAGFPGIVRSGIIQESPNLGQLKGLHIEQDLRAALKADGLDVPVVALNDADALAAGIAATLEKLESLIRVWYLGDGIGFGRYPKTTGVWEGGHMVVSLDPKERYCGCGGQGHLEGIMGHRAMRLRFLDMEPEEIFMAARHGDQRAADFVRLWHRALAAGTATSIHLDGPGRFYIAGPNCDYVDVNLLGSYVQDMVKMSPLQGSFFELTPTSHDLALIGAAVSSTMR